MKHNFLAWRNLDAGTPEEKGGGQGAIIKAINENFTKTTEQIEAVKTAHQKSLEDMKKDLTEDVTSAKSLAQKTADAIDELKKQVAMVKSSATPENRVKSFDEVLTAAIEEKTDEFAKMGRGEKGVKSIIVELKDFNQKAVADFSTGNVTGGTVYGAIYKPGIIANPNTRTHMRQIINTAPAGPGTDYYFMKENGAGEGSIAPTSEKKATAATTQATGLKPQFDLDLVESSVRFETIAGFMLLSNKSLNNIPGLLGFLSNRVPQKLMDVEDAQILYGDGNTPNIKGIFTSGNFTAGQGVGATVLVEKIIKDLSTFEDTYKRKAGAIIMRPADYYSFFLNKASGSGEYNLPNGVVFVNGVLYILGVPVSTCTNITANDYGVIDLMGMDLLVQQSMALEFFKEDGTNVRTNQVTLRVEETIALPVYGSDYVLKGSSALA